MRHRRPDLIVPVKDRRARRRYLTLKNFGWLTLASVIAFAAITIRSELRDPSHHGRLSEQRYESVVEQKPVEVVEESASSTGSSLPMRSSEPQLLAIDPAAALIDTPSMTTATAPTGGRIAIVGGREGLTLVHDPARKPELSGGFGR
jgi:hypothetical protein